MTISWDSNLDQPYAVEYKNNLIIEPTWSVYTNVIGTGVGMSVDVPATATETYYQVISE